MPPKVRSTSINFTSADPVLTKQVTEAFTVFDVEYKGKIDIREVGTVVRSLGMCPSEADLQQLVSAMEDNGNNQTISLEKFIPVVTGLMQQKRFQPASDDLIFRAFQTLDLKNKGFLTKEELESALTSNGEPFSAEEMKEMWTAVIAVGGTTDTETIDSDEQEAIDYETYTRFMTKQS